MDARRSPSPDPSSRAALTAELAALIMRFTPVDGEHRTVIPSLAFHRYSGQFGPDYVFARSALIFAAQGSKTVSAGDVSYHYDTSHCLVTSLDLPVVGQVNEATPEKPYLCYAFELDLKQVANLVASRELPPPDDAPSVPGISAGELPVALLEAACRLARLLDTPRHIPTLAPLIEQEIIYRVLMSSQGLRLRHALVADSRAARIAGAVEWIKTHYAVPLRIDTLAEHVSMSVSSLHRHFKEATAMSPLQYQKRLRLFEARRLLLARASDIGVVASAVGYDSLSQFHREYKRLFGVPPMQDATRLRRED